MGTRSNVAIILKEEDFNKKLNLMDPRFDDCRPNLYCPNCRQPIDTPLTKIFGDVIVTKQDDKVMLACYIHWDGYPEGVGQDLLTHYKDYESVLAFILSGAKSSCNGFDVEPYALGGDDWKHCIPMVLPAYKVLEEYLYVFENGEWYVSDWGNDDYDMTPLSEAI